MLHMFLIETFLTMEKKKERGDFWVVEFLEHETVLMKEEQNSALRR